METRFRWVQHSVGGLKLFFDISYDADETCSEEQEMHVKEIDLPRPVLETIAGQQIPEIPDEIKNSSEHTMEEDTN